MEELKYIFFDCMETVIEKIKKPGVHLNAWWAYDGCGYEGLWDNYECFYQDYRYAVMELGKLHAPDEEYPIIDIFNFMIRKKLSNSAAYNQSASRSGEEDIVLAISRNHWRNYRLNTYVDDAVRMALSDLNSKFRCAVVSNYMIQDGIETLLEMHDIRKYFSFVVTSIGVGWKKPHEKIYQAALELAGVQRNQVLFVGNDYACDYEGPRKCGIDSVWLDKENENLPAEKRIERLEQLTDLLL